MVGQLHDRVYVSPDVTLIQTTKVCFSGDNSDDTESVNCRFGGAQTKPSVAQSPHSTLQSEDFGGLGGTSDHGYKVGGRLRTVEAQH